MKTEQITIPIDELDYRALLAHSDRLEDHAAAAFVEWNKRQIGGCKAVFIPPPPRPGWNCQSEGEGIREIDINVAEHAVASLRALGGSFQEHAFHAVKWYVKTVLRGEQAPASGQPQYVRLKDQTGQFHDQRTGLRLLKTEIQPLPQDIGPLTALWLKHGGLIRCDADGRTDPNAPPPQPLPGLPGGAKRGASARPIRG